MKTSNLQMHPLQGVAPEDAIGMLMADHRRVAGLFALFKQLTDEERDDEKAAVVTQICHELTVHTQLEEELFYPAVREAIDDDDQVDEAVVEHAGAKQLITELSAAEPGSDLYDARVTVLGEQIDHHVEEEEGSMFPKARHSGLDTIKLGAAMMSRKAELQNGASGGMPELRLSPSAKTSGGNGKRLAAATAPDTAATAKPRRVTKKKSVPTGKATKTKGKGR